MTDLRIHRSKNTPIALGLLLTLFLQNTAHAQMFQGSTVNTSVTKPAFSQSEPYGLNWPNDIYSVGNPTNAPVAVRANDESTATTRHYRWGSSTGIGNSFIQTASPTSESRKPIPTYQNSTTSPAMVPASSFANIKTTPTFSQSMQSPALSPAVRNNNETLSGFSDSLSKYSTLTMPSSNIDFGQGFIRTNRSSISNMGF